VLSWSGEAQVSSEILSEPLIQRQKEKKESQSLMTKRNLLHISNTAKIGKLVAGAICHRIGFVEMAG
jgi:hypothetical protein